MRILTKNRFVRLVWLVIPLVLFGIIGILDLHAEPNVSKGGNHLIEKYVKAGIISLPPSILFEEDFTKCTTNQCDDTWSSTDIDNLNTNTTKNHLFWNVPQTGGTTLLHQISFDLGSGTVPDTNWTLRFPVNLEFFSQGSSQNIQVLWVGLSDKDKDVDLTSSQDSIGFQIRADGLGSFYNAAYGDNVGLNTNKIKFTDIPESGSFVVEITRESAESASVTIGSETLLLDISSSVDDLRYIKLVYLAERSSSDHILSGNIPLIQLFDNASR